MRRVFFIIAAIILTSCADMNESVREIGPREHSVSETTQSDRFAHFENRFFLLLFAILTYPFAEKH